LIHQIYNDPYGRWSDVSKEQYDGWDGEKRIVEVVATHFGRASRFSSRAVFKVVNSLTKEFAIHHPLGDMQHFEVRVPGKLVNEVKQACRERLPNYLRIEILARDGEGK
jgi:hypothetical protein